MPDIEQTIFLVDDDDAIRISLTRALKQRGFQVKSYDCAKSFLQDYTQEQYGCLLLDYGLPGMNGLELQKHLIREDFLIPIIFITGHGGVPESVEAMKNGAVDFLEKPFRQIDLVKCINVALEKNLTLQRVQQANIELKYKLKNLTTREKEILQFIISNPSNTSSKDIGRALDISHRTVDHHRAKILDKLAVKSVAELIDLLKNADFLLN